MQKPRARSSNEVSAQQERASLEVTRGIESQIAEFHKLDNTRRMEEILFFLAVYGIGAMLVFHFPHNPVTMVGGVVCMGFTLNSFLILIHEGLHGLLAATPRVNHLLSFLLGLPVLVSASAYQVTHTNHHYELGRKLDYGTYRQHTKRNFLVWLAYFAQLTVGGALYVMFIPFLSFRSASARARKFILFEYGLILSVLGLTFYVFPIGGVLLYWMYPLLIATALTNIRGIASHALGDVENIYLSSRTITSSGWVAFLFLYENYHLEHHIFPSVPSYNLRALHKLIWNRLPEAVYSKSYCHFLLTFFQAAVKGDLSPAGVVNPRTDGVR